MNEMHSAAGETFAPVDVLYDVCESRAEEPWESPLGGVLWAGLKIWLIRPN